ncbi:hypothetical protein GN956_G6942 [Arapaima gigas]
MFDRVTKCCRVWALCRTHSLRPLAEPSELQRCTRVPPNRPQGHLQDPVKMKVLPQMLLCCCLLAATMSRVDAAKLTWSSGMKDRFATWLMSRTRQAVMDANTAHLVHSKDTGLNAIPHPSIRLRRSNNSASRPACPLLTCAVHNLFHVLSDLQHKRSSAPLEKIRPEGYGRRRRSLARLHPHGVPLLQT